VGIRDFIRYLKEHQERLKRGPELSDVEREETLREAETMVGMADAAIRELGSVLGNRRVNLPEEHAVRFAQDVFLYLREEEERVKEALREPVSRGAAKSRVPKPP
jgi:phenylalanyl-tRNA synthetase alpha subunit